jgi:hypothetical protein
LEELRNPELAADRMRREYAALGYTDQWIDQRLQGIAIRDELTQEWREREAHEGKEFGVLTDTLHRGTFDISTTEHRQVKHISARSNLRDSMTRMELLLTGLAEETAVGLHHAHDSLGFEELRSDTHEAGEWAGTVRQEYEMMTGRQVVSAENYKKLRQGRQRELQAPLFEETAGDAPEE